MYDPQLKSVIIYTDGACKGNPGKGGYGVVMITQINCNEYKKEFCQGYQLTTNNRMELLAVIKALNKLKYPCNVNLYSDSKYVVDSINKKWIDSWKKNNFKRDKPIKNIDLWKQLIPLLEIHNVNFFWVKGHSTNKFNERCDLLANQAINSDDLLIDEGYE